MYGELQGRQWYIVAEEAGATSCDPRILVGGGRAGGRVGGWAGEQQHMQE